MTDIYDSIYSQDHPEGDAHGSIQWKGTDACIDLHCACGHHGHFDGYFLNHFQCPACGVKYSMGCNVRMIPLTPEQVEWVEKSGHFKTCELDEYAEDSED